ncbi:ankyrin repeat and MYND domain-containing protein 1 isoform X4 [Oryctolagus cuniculus]|uniref:ankyrin repeat and MYND domain-containing protein 1 isoform X4 n=1 Tax=Oryctolagus cuniculus TaxID=9986 RepID=UPI00222F9177|nr:ankyrin repeat and MYND domain-containing protein 1 isoform X4 [Oryctolagus cuniculus]
MEGGLSPFIPDYEAADACDPQPSPQGSASAPPADGDPRSSPDSSALFPQRCGPAVEGEAPMGPEEEEEQEEEEEEEGAEGLEGCLEEARLQLEEGEQHWQDGCFYRGQFGLNTKLGFGEFSWPTGESYRGQFYRDHCHGLGTYVWPDGSSFTGTFYLSRREGYGTMYMKTRVFQGLYRADERFGPGVETYPDGSQDVGLWFREHLIKLCTEAPRGFSLLSHPELACFSEQSRARLSPSEEGRAECGPQQAQDPFLYEYKRFLLHEELPLPPDMYVYSTDHCHLPMTRAFRRELDAWIFLDDAPLFVEDEEPWLITNETPLLVKIQKQAYKFRNKKAHSGWNMGAILEGNREGFAHCGPKEQLSREMILKAEEGDHDWIAGILKDNLANANVADAKGYTVLAAAAEPGLLFLQVHCHMDVVNLLLDFGADVNKRTDEGVTPLNMCFLLHYPAKSFKPNIAERTLPEPQELPKPQGIPNLTFSLDEMDAEPGDEGPAPVQDSPEQLQALHAPDAEGSPGPGPQQSPEATVPMACAQEQDCPLAKGSAGDADKANPDKCTLYSNETHFESNLCVHNFCIEVSQDILEMGAQAHSMLPAPPARDKGTMRKMALSMVEHRNRWLTIKLLLHRGADPNLCCAPVQVLFLAVKAGDVHAVKLLLESGARTDIRLPQQLGALTPLHIAAALPGEEGVKITELLLHSITDVDAQAADQDHVYKPNKMDLQSSSLKLSNEPGPPSTYYSPHTSVPEEGGRTALHVACERQDNDQCATEVVRLLLSHRANPNTLWSGHSPLSLSIASGNDLIVRELLSRGVDPNLPLSRGLGSALCVVCDIAHEQLRSTSSRLALVDELIRHGADILKPVTLTQGDKVAVGTAVDYGYFKFFQDRKIAHCPYHALMPAERETLLARKRLLEHMGTQLRLAVLAKESQWDARALCLSKRAELISSHRLRKRNSSLPRTLSMEEPESVPFFKFCYHCGRSIGVRLSPCTRCYGILTCSKHCKTKAWAEFHKKDCSDLVAIAREHHYSSWLTRSSRKLQKEPSKGAPQDAGSTRTPRGHPKHVHSGYGVQ